MAESTSVENTTTPTNQTCQTSSEMLPDLMASINLNMPDGQSTFEASQVPLPASPQLATFASAPTDISQLITVSATPAASLSTRRVAAPARRSPRASPGPSTASVGRSNSHGVSTPATPAATDVPAFAFLGRSDRHPHAPREAFTFADAGTAANPFARRFRTPTRRLPQLPVIDEQSAVEAAQVALPATPLSLSFADIPGIGPSAGLFDEVMLFSARTARRTASRNLTLGAPITSFGFANTSKAKAFGP